MFASIASENLLVFSS